MREGRGGDEAWEDDGDGREKYACGRKRKPNQLITDPSTQRDGDGEKIKVENRLQQGKK